MRTLDTKLLSDCVYRLAAKAGLTLTDVFGDTDESFLSYNLPTFWATRAVKK